MKVMWFFADSSQQELNTSNLRVFIPAQILQEAGHECRIAHVSGLFASNYAGAKEVKDALDWSDVVVIERLLVNDTHAIISDLMKRGKKVWATFDDAYHLLPGSPSRDTWRGGKNALQGRGTILNEFRKGLRLCSGAMIPSKLLASDYEMYGRMVYVPNYLNQEMWDNIARKESDIITIGYGGTSLHNISLRGSGVIPALGNICKKYPRVQVHLQPAYSDIVDLFKKSGVRFVTGNWQTPTDWMETVSNFSIGIAPLSGEYDRRRSSLKVTEFCSAGVPWVATDDAPYQDCNRGGIRVRNRSGEWYDALDTIVRRITSGDREMGNQGREWARNFNSKCVSRYEGVLNE